MIGKNTSDKVEELFAPTHFRVGGFGFSMLSFKKSTGRHDGFALLWVLELKPAHNQSIMADLHAFRFRIYSFTCSCLVSPEVLEGRRLRLV